MRAPRPDCAHAQHVEMDALDHDRDANGTPVASAAVADAIAAGLVVTAPRRGESPNGLAWPGVVPRRRYW